ncbi:MAG: hypothetical protein IJT80_04775, partial [Lachnospiraceae bacterium]|nr:hypothetical protein [Lachnospiraceae bacterium]
DKNLILYKLQQKLRSYNNYYELGMMADALNALVQAVGDIDENRENAEKFGILDRFNELADEIISELDVSFDVSEDQARKWLAIGDSQEYSKALYGYVENGSTGGDGEDVETYDFYDTNPVIDGEESEFDTGSGEDYTSETLYSDEYTDEEETEPEEEYTDEEEEPEEEEPEDDTEDYVEEEPEEEPEDDTEEGYGEDDYYNDTPVGNPDDILVL